MSTLGKDCVRLISIISYQPVQIEKMVILNFMTRYFILINLMCLHLSLDGQANNDHLDRTSKIECTNILSSSNVKNFVSEVKDRSLRDLSAISQNIVRFTEAIERIAQRDRTFEKLLSMIKRHQYTFAMDRTPNRRMQILEHGFSNLHQTGTSLGVPRVNERTIIESNYFGIKPEDYLKIDNVLKPKSMYLIPTKESGFDWLPTIYATNSKTNKVTNDTWVFDLSAISDQTLFVVGDSYNRALIEGQLMADQSELNIKPDAKFSGMDPVNYLLPLESLSTSIPFFYQQILSQNLLRFVDPTSAEYLRPLEELKKDFEDVGMRLQDWQILMMDDMQPNFDSSFFDKFPELIDFKNFLFKPRGNYVEGLFIGALPAVGKVSALIYRDTPPSPEEMRKFTEANIKVIDGRAR